MNKQQLQQQLRNWAENYDEAKGIITDAQTLGRDVTADEERQFKALMAQANQAAKQFNANNHGIFDRSAPIYGDVGFGELDAFDVWLKQDDTDGGGPVATRMQPDNGQTRDDQPNPMENRPNGGPARDKTYRGMFYGGEQRTHKLDRGGFKSQAEFFEVLESNRFDPRLQRSIMTEGVLSAGGFSVPEEFSAQWLDASLESEIVRPRAQVWPMASATRKIPGWDSSNHTGGTLFGGLAMEWLAETGTGTKQSAKVRQITLEAKKGGIYVDISRELQEDGLGFEAQLEMALVASIGYGLDYKFMFGSGAGCPQGAFNTANPALIVVDAEEGQSTGIAYENIAKMYARMAPRCIPSSCWHANRTLLPQLLTISIPVGTAGVHVPVLNESNGEFSMLGRPVVWTEHCPAMNTQGDLALCDWTQYAVGMRRELAIDSSNVPGWTQDLMSYRILTRVDGQGTWNAAITPRNGDTLSWAVVLGARS